MAVESIKALLFNYLYPTGRTHRSNQVTAPEYVFLISELAGEQRFASIVAKRLESLVNANPFIHLYIVFFFISLLQQIYFFTGCSHTWRPKSNRDKGPQSIQL